MLPKGTVDMSAGGLDRTSLSGENKTCFQAAARCPGYARATLERIGRYLQMAKKSRGGRMAAAKKRAANAPGGRGAVKKRKAGKKIMKT